MCVLITSKMLLHIKITEKLKLGIESNTINIGECIKRSIWVTNEVKI